MWGLGHWRDVECPFFVELPSLAGMPHSSPPCFLPQHDRPFNLADLWPHTERKQSCLGHIRPGPKGLWLLCLEQVWCYAGMGCTACAVCLTLSALQKDRPTNPCLYWINSYNGDKQFNVATASGARSSAQWPAFTKCLHSKHNQHHGIMLSRWMLGSRVDS